MPIRRRAASRSCRASESLVIRQLMMRRRAEGYAALASWSAIAPAACARPRSARRACGRSRRGCRSTRCDYDGGPALHVRDNPGVAGAMLPGAARGQRLSRNGTIDAMDARAGRATISSEAARGFIGIAFTGARRTAAATRPSTCARPTAAPTTSCGATTPAQYISEPDFPWERLRRGNARPSMKAMSIWSRASGPMCGSRCSGNQCLAARRTAAGNRC